MTVNLASTASNEALTAPTDASGAASSPDVAAPSDKLWTRSFVMITLCYFCLFICLQMLLSPFPSYVKDRFHPNDAAVSLVTSLFALTAIGARFATAWLMDRIGRSLLLFAGVVLAAVATAAYSFPVTFQGVLLLRILFGLGFGISSTVLPTLVTQLIPRHRLGEGVGYFGLSTNLAMSVGPALGLTILQRDGFPMLTVWGTLAVAAIVPLYALRGGSGVQTVRATDSSQPPSASAPAKLGAAAYGPALLNVLLSGCYGGILSFLALYGKTVGVTNIGAFFLCNAVTVLIVRTYSGKLYDRYGHGVVLLPGAAAVAASLLVLSYMHGLPMLGLAGLLFGLGYGAIQPTLQAWMLRGVSRSAHGRANSLFYNTIDFGVAVGAMLLGVLAASTGYADMYRISALLMLLFAGVYGWIVMRARKRA